MPLPIPINTKQKIEFQLKARIHPKAIEYVFGISRRTLNRIRSNIKHFGIYTALVGLRKRTGRPRIITNATRGALRSFINSKPWAYQDKMQ